jgi:hypothetical protein
MMSIFWKNKVTNDYGKDIADLKPVKETYQKEFTIRFMRQNIFVIKHYLTHRSCSKH